MDKVFCIPIVQIILHGTEKNVQMLNVELWTKKCYFDT